MKRFLRPITAACALAAMTAPSAWALLDIAIGNTQGLAFGRFVAGSGGFVTVSPSGSRSASGGVLLVPSSPGFAAEFTVSGDPNATYTIQLPGNDFVRLTGPGDDMTINDFTSNPSGVNGQLGAGGSQTLSVGATLSVGNSQASGDYSGSFTVTVNYN